LADETNEKKTSSSFREPTIRLSFEIDRALLLAMPAAPRPIAELIEEYRGVLPTPYYLIDEQRLLRNLEIIAAVRERSGAKSVLALKCFSTWSVFGLMREYLDGTTSSSLFEARLGHEKFGKEVHAYSVGFTDDEIAAVRPFATKIIFNSVSQLKRFHAKAHGVPIGLRLNPGVSYSGFELADPARPQSRLGATNRAEIDEVSGLISGLMFHCQCENDQLPEFESVLAHIEHEFTPLLEQVEWVSLGGGIFFTKEGYPLDAFCRTLAAFSRRYGVQVYLEPGETAVTRSAYLVTQVIDLVQNGADIAIVDAGTECHMLDLLVYRMSARLESPAGGDHRYVVAGRSCLAGDIFGTFDFPKALSIGSLIPLADAAAYTMVKKNWFNGLAMPSIVVRRLDGRIEVVRKFGYEEYLASLS
jgi:carboxynorspermidine decarboxylase